MRRRYLVYRFAGHPPITAAILAVPVELLLISAALLGVGISLCL